MPFAVNIAFVGKTPVGVVKRWPDDGSVAGAGAWRWWVDNLSCWPGYSQGLVAAVFKDRRHEAGHM